MRSATLLPRSRLCLSLLCVGSLVAQAAEVPAQTPRGPAQSPHGAAQTLPLQLEGTRFRLHCHFANEDLAKDALRSVEALWRPAIELFGDPELGDAERLNVHLYPDAAAYRAADKRLTGGRFQRNLAFADWGSITAHVAMQPEQSEALRGRLGLSLQTRRLLVHEAAHLVRYRAMPNYRSHPDWFADGAASWLEWVVLRDLRLVHEARGEEPTFSTMMLRVKRLSDAGRLPKVAAILRDQLAGLQFYERYALRWALFEYLSTEYPRPLRKVVAEIRRLGGGAKFVERVARVVDEQLGATTLKKLDASFGAFVAAFAPRWRQDIRLLARDGERWLQTAFPSSNAIAWRIDEKRARLRSLRGSFTILSGGGGKQLNLLLDKQEDGFVSLALVAGYGVTAFVYVKDKRRWERIGTAKAELALDKPYAFEVKIGGEGELELSLGDKSILQLETKRNFDGPWGVGAQAGAAGAWRGLVAQRE
jgi:hypothetical protein